MKKRTFDLEERLLKDKNEHGTSGHTLAENFE